ncbi:MULTISPECIES: hypothetical protein [Mesonia]|uniref:Uncharacterized protein n=1 Tax=Mesonia oceanica TaxID=2687242 RepID=A0AC61Y7T2_9FLAO|nr:MULTISPECIES: hypothetical protein [Mesonia]MAN26539.1 hypothetical protein [Mesonia sp.]MAQ40807.1 hypothetical protein [Mesonia sp.]MBJ97728.1 hypothetical protein [Flavobacteriaceae bacterium]VVU99434.1 hypothetical protein FVB9532_00688 [Mesonia oceanica]|tara:strand:- start:7680 stop:8051 length:372 start_codon:yes stop_codon:yes gene_type:complete
MLENFSEIIQQQYKEEQFEVQFKLNANHELYTGHFPNQKVTPAVVMIHLFKELAENFTTERLQLKQASNLKFLSVLNPDENNLFICNGTLELQENDWVLKGLAKTSSQVIAKVKLIFTTFVDH